MFDRARAIRINEKGNRLAALGNDDAAEAEYRRAITLDPGYDAAWFNLGLVAKRRRDWHECRRCNERAAELTPQKEAPAWWNLGIASTALRDWKTARRAWRGYGIDIPDGDGPITANFGATPVRIGSPENIEVVWCRRIDPARAVIESIPLPESGHRHGDVVLHDGTPNGEREWHGRTYSVFDELERWQPSSTPTTAARLTCRSEADAASVTQLAEAAELANEDWSANVNMLCKACSEGRRHREHDHDGDGSWRIIRNFGFAGDPHAVVAVLERWRAQGGGREIENLEVF